MTSLKIYPFFLRCAEREVDPRRRDAFVNFALQKGSLLRPRGVDGDVAFVGADAEFIIPNDSNDDDVVVESFVEFVTNDTEFEALGRTIHAAKLTWMNMKKRERVKMLDEYVVRRAPKRVMSSARAALTMATVLKLISPKDIVYADYAVESVRGEMFGVDFESIDAADASTDSRSESSRTA